MASGGRSGVVLHVTNLNNSGAGSFRDAAISNVTRTIVFDVSGTINLLSILTINRSNVTIAGQTAPGDGITLKGRMTTVSSTRNVIVRFLHCRPGDINCPGSMDDDAFDVVNCRTVMVDHVSSTWSEDEALSVTGSTNVTVQWCMIAEPLNHSCHDEGSGIENHGYGSLLRYGAGGLSYHHNLYAHARSRNPRLGDNIHLDWVNNVIYNWADTAGYNANDSVNTPGFTNWLNYVGNYLIVGTNTTQSPSRAFKCDTNNPAFRCQIYQSDNLIDTNKTGQLAGFDKGWASFSGPFTTNLTRLAFPLVTTDSPTTAYVRVLSSVGASLVRDFVDAGVVSNVMTKTGKIINSQTEVGGWPVVYSRPTPTDTDQDGMPNFWETALGWNSSDATDRNGLTADGYTRLEGYLNWLADPHTSSQTGSVAYVELLQYTAGLLNPIYAVSGASNGVVTLLGDGHNAQFTPTTGLSGLGSFVFTASNSFSSLSGTVSVVVSPLTVTTNLIWRGDGTTNNWDTVATANWLIGAMNVKFYAGDNVIFNNAGSNSPPINLIGTLLPSSVSVTGSQNYTFGGSGSLGGLMSLVKSGSGQLTVTTSNTYSGGTIVSNGTLLINNTGGSATGTGTVTVVNGAVLGGSGIIGGPVTVNGTLSPGNSPGTLTINNDLIVGGGTVLQYDLGTNSDLTAVLGNLTLGGTLNINDAGGFTNTTYTLFTYGGALTYTNVSIGTAPAGYTYVINTNTAGQVNLVVTLPVLTPFEQWQVDYFGSTNNPAADPNFDADGDGMNNTNEFLSGTNPTNSLSALRIISAMQETTDVVITWKTASGHTNVVQATAGDIDGGYTTNFTDISGLFVIPGSGDATTNHVDTGGATNVPSRYYRIRLVP